ncbi:MAG: leucyl/phenylalanyl-tRNA--protein transferase [Deltaproteobacteria bacterium]|nr:MAG: leucyl/phenylalanyl-tRNA--protein transferase [Deltaproteobacteria bacterium]
MRIQHWRPNTTRAVIPYPPIEPPHIAVRFPEPRRGEDVVAVSRSLSPALVLEAYRGGIFPWPVRQGLVPWASPDPRAIFPLASAGPWPRTVRRAFRSDLRVSFDEAFDDVMRACADRPREGTWITPDILHTYSELHRLGWAHSVEVWHESTLAGGLYGIAMGALFAGESMFHRVSGASKVAFASCVDRLRERGFLLFDVQVLTAHLSLLGCREISRDDYRARVREALGRSARFV